MGSVYIIRVVYMGRKNPAPRDDFKSGSIGFRGGGLMVGEEGGPWSSDTQFIVYRHYPFFHS